MKILFVLECANLNTNGTTATCVRFAEELRKKGHTVKILGCTALDGNNPPDYIPLKHYKFPLFEGLIRKEGFMFAKIDYAILYNAIKDADVVHLFLPFKLEKQCQLIADSLGVACTSASHLQPQNISSAIRLGWFEPLNNILFYSFRKYLYDYTRHVHCPSTMIEDQLKIHKHRFNTFHVISNGITDFFHPIDVERPEELKDKITVTMVGRLASEKRQDLIIRACAESKYNSRIQLILCGQGPAKKRYEKLAKKVGLANPLMIKFCTKEELREILNYSDIYVHASDYEIEGISCIEAFACGAVPVISDSPLSATSGFCIDPRLLFKHGIYKSLKHRIDFLIENPKYKEKLSKMYVASAKNFALPLMVTKMEEMFADAIDDVEKGVSNPQIFPRKKDIRKSRKIFKKLIKAGVVDKMPERLAK